MLSLTCWDRLRDLAVGALLLAAGCASIGFDDCLPPRNEYRLMTVVGGLPDTTSPSQLIGVIRVELQEYRPDSVLGLFVVYGEAPPGGSHGGPLRDHVTSAWLEDSAGSFATVGTTPMGADYFLGAPATPIHDSPLLNRARTAFLQNKAVLVVETDLTGYPQLRTPLVLTTNRDWTWYRCS